MDSALPTGGPPGRTKLSRSHGAVGRGGLDKLIKFGAGAKAGVLAGSNDGALDRILGKPREQNGKLVPRSGGQGVHRSSDSIEADNCDAIDADGHGEIGHRDIPLLYSF